MHWFSDYNPGGGFKFQLQPRIGPGNALCLTEPDHWVGLAPRDSEGRLLINQRFTIKVQINESY